MAIRLAAAQIALSDNLDYNVRKAIRVLEQASELGVDLICFPEMSLTGYNTSTLSSGDLNDRVGTALSILRDRCRSLGVGAIVGHGHREGYALLNRATVILPDGGRFHYDKIHITDSERRIMQPGRETLCFPLGEMKAGVIICRDQNDPLLARQLKEGGAQVLFVLAAHYYPPKEARWKVEKNRALPVARAVENGLYVLLSNPVGTHVGMTSLGNSLISDPDGCVISLAGETEETIITCSVDMG